MPHYENKYMNNMPCIKPAPAKLIYLNFPPLEAVSRYRDPQPQKTINNAT